MAVWMLDIFWKCGSPTRVGDSNYLEPTANMDYNKSSEYFVFQLFRENLILIKYPWAVIHE